MNAQSYSIATWIELFIKQKDVDTKGIETKINGNGLVSYV